MHWSLLNFILLRPSSLKKTLILRNMEGKERKRQRAALDELSYRNDKFTEDLKDQIRDR